MRSIVSVPCDSESLTNVFVVGLDQYFIRIAPSSQFDRLPEDYNKPFLLLAAVALGIATVFLGRLVSWKQQQAAWV